MPFAIEKHAAFDVETAGKYDERHALQPYRWRRGESILTSSAVAWVSEGKLKAICEQDPNVAFHERMLKWAIKNDITLVGWNMAFDAAWLCAQGLTDLVMQAKWLDAMLLWQHLEREPEYEMASTKKREWKLKVAVAEYFPKYAGYGEDIDFQSQEPAVVAKRLNYNKMDVGFTLKLAQIFYNKLEEEGKYRVRNALIEACAIPLVSDRMVEGLTINTKAAHDLDRILVETQETVLEELSEYGADAKTLASPAKLSALLYDDWGLPIVKKTPKGQPSTDKEAMYMLAAHDERAPRVQDYREAKGNRKKFVTNILDSVEYNGDGKTRPNMRIYGTYTGRATFASAQGKNKDRVQTGFAIHQMKNAPEYRRLVTAPPGYVIVEWDAASQEYRWMAIESGDDTMLSLCLPGEDPHSYMGARIGHAEYEWVMKHKDGEAKPMRKAGKVGNLSCQYRIGYKTLRIRANVNHGMPIDNKEAKTIHSTYHSTYRGVKRYWNRQVRRCRERGYAETLAGRRVQLKGQWSHPQMSWKLESTAVNFPIQGIGADQKFLAMKLLKDVLPRVGGHFYFELHDGLYAILPEKTAMRDGLIIRDMLTNLPYKKAWGFTPPVPLPWDMKIGKNWGDLKEQA